MKTNKITELKNYFCDCFEIIDIIMMVIVYGTLTEKIEIIKDMINADSGLYRLGDKK